MNLAINYGLFLAFSFAKNLEVASWKIQLKDLPSSIWTTFMKSIPARRPFLIRYVFIFSYTPRI